MKGLSEILAGMKNENKFYHVTDKWGSGPLRPIGDEAAFLERWPDAGALSQYHAYKVHMYDNINDAKQHARDVGGKILEIDPNKVNWEIDDLEFPHPVTDEVSEDAIIRIIKEILE